MMVTIACRNRVKMSRMAGMVSNLTGSRIQGTCGIRLRQEVEAAFERERKDGTTVLFPIRLDDAVMDSDAAWAASIRRIRHIGDFSKWKDHDEYQKSLARLIRDLQADDKTKPVST